MPAGIKRDSGRKACHAEEQRTKTEQNFSKTFLSPQHLWGAFMRSFLRRIKLSLKKQGREQGAVKEQIQKSLGQEIMQMKNNVKIF